MRLPSVFASRFFVGPATALLLIGVAGAPLSRADFSLAVRGTADLAGGAWTANGVALEASSEVPGMIDALLPVGLDAFFLRLEAIPK